MTESSLRRHTAIFGLVATVISLTDVPPYFMYTSAPPQWDILTRVLVGIVSSTILIVVWWIILASIIMLRTPAKSEA
jgi:hypothetical protein